MKFALLFGLGLSTGLWGAMIPGPLFLYTVSEAFRSGQMAGIKIAVGHLMLETCFVTLIIVGLRDLLAAAWFRSAVVWIGGGGLIIMSGLILTQLKQLSLPRAAHVTFRWGPIVGGALFSILSPGFIIWWATIGAAVLLQGLLAGTLGLVMVATGHAIADLAWGWFVAFSVERGKAYCTDHMYRAIMAGIALWLIGLGIWLPVASLRAP